ncbi:MULTISPECIES: TonB-dependent siderophore receptor [Acetobacter]|uniref:Outer membrane receptor for ferric coprogen and ferric-rhodotorulic acid n=1 Tax=Acetobacter lovaniensis TaxID=104100 RepID=A0A841QII1_9PROT|nr:TonB-dependent siderophore receptor [Acetobacter lovaniensis]MBB6458248.1 outer membrane receptor for ferric coprogen and ferric-rhodotorulic acid [Acetobacter lovaniensis]MCP1240469.1 TonB-dependent siderophore receptor [Acetobacter lovaniensis]GBQ70459.1 TonB-dependent siderophore receptor [Acetobacter lovaniensis NRIC 0474]
MKLHPVTSFRVTGLLASTVLSLGGALSAQAADTAYNTSIPSEEVVEKRADDRKAATVKTEKNQKTIVNVVSRTNESILVKARRWDRGSYTAPETSASTGLPLSLRETPQTVTVMTRQVMDDQQINTLDDVLTTTPGVTSYANDNAGRTTYRARGFDITNYKIDGMQIDASTSFGGVGSSMNMDLYDNVQIVRGANGLLGGTGDPSATIYLQRKAPQREFSANGLLRLGNWNEHRVMADLNAPLNHTGTIRSRYVFSWDDTDTFRVREHVNRIGALANFTADISSRDTLDFGFQYEKTRNDGASWGTNVPIWYADGTNTNLSRSTNPAADWSQATRDQYTAFINYDHDFSAGWHLKAGYMRTQGSSYNNLGVAKINNATRKTYGGFWNQDGTGAYLNALHAEYEDARDNADVHVSGPVHFLGHEHQLVFGFNGYNDELTQYTFSNTLGNCSIAGVTPYSGCQYRATGLPIANWQTWDGSYPNFVTYRTHAREVDVTRNYGAYTSGRFVLAKGLSLILGGRMSSYQAYTGTYGKTNQYSGSSSTGQQNAVLTPYAGMVYDFTKTMSIYGSYTNVFTPQSNLRDASNKPLNPVVGKSYETGVKGSFFRQRLNTSLAFYLNRQSNVAQATGATNVSTGEAIYDSVNGVKTEGIDLDASGELLPGWNVFFGYSYLYEKGLSYRQDPHHLVRLTTSYTFPGKLHHLTVGGGISSQSSTEWTTNPGRPLGGGRYDASNLRVKGYTLINIMARYRAANWLDIAGNITNLTNRTYVRQAGFYDGMIYGEPRTFSFTLRGHY